MAETLKKINCIKEHILIASQALHAHKKKDKCEDLKTERRARTPAMGVGLQVVTNRLLTCLYSNNIFQF